MTTVDTKTPSFNCRRNQGFQIKFGNGYTISVQFGSFHYCSKRDLTASASYDTWRQGDENHSSPDAEVAILDPNGEFVLFTNGEMVRPRTKPDTVADMISWIMQQKAPNAT